MVSRISETGDDLWKSCTERVESFAPGGRRMVTVHILSDGIGPNAASVRTVDGRLSAATRSRAGSVRSLRVAEGAAPEANGKRQATTVGASGSDCERAGHLCRRSHRRAG